MNAKDLLQINEQMMAFNTIMKESLKAELDAAQNALDALGDAQALAGAQAKLDADKAAYETYKISVQSIFDETKAELQAEQSKLASDQAALDVHSENLSIAQEILVGKQADFQVMVESNKAQADQDKAEIAAARTKVWADQALLATALANVTAREDTVAAKLAAIQAAAA